jgi:hypothetical protein
MSNNTISDTVNPNINRKNVYLTISDITEQNKCYDSNEPVSSKCQWPMLVPPNQLLTLNADTNNPLNCVTKENFECEDARWCQIEQREYFEPQQILKVIKDGKKSFTMKIDKMSDNYVYTASDSKKSCENLIYVASGPVQIKCPKNEPCEYSKKVYSIGLTTPVEDFIYHIHFPIDLGSFRKIIVGGYATEKCKLPDKKPALIKIYIGKKLLTTLHMTSQNVSILHKVKISRQDNGNYILKH